MTFKIKKIYIPHSVMELKIKSFELNVLICARRNFVFVTVI